MGVLVMLKDWFITIWIILFPILLAFLYRHFYYLGKHKVYTEVYAKKKPLNIRKAPFKWGWFAYVGKCANCSTDVNHIENKYCGNCGQRQDWSEISG